MICHSMRVRSRQKKMLSPITKVASDVLDNRIGLAC